MPEFEKIPEVKFYCTGHLEIKYRKQRKISYSKNYHSRCFATDITQRLFRRLFAGPSHVLPTRRSARFSSGLRVDDFLRRSSFIDMSLREAEPQINCFAEMENLDGHGSSVNVRSSHGD